MRGIWTNWFIAKSFAPPSPTPPNHPHGLHLDVPSTPSIQSNPIHLRFFHGRSTYPRHSPHRTERNGTPYLKHRSSLINIHPLSPPQNRHTHRLLSPSPNTPIVVRNNVWSFFFCRFPTHQDVVSFTHSLTHSLPSIHPSILLLHVNPRNGYIPSLFIFQLSIFYLPTTHNPPSLSISSAHVVGSYA